MSLALCFAFAYIAEQYFGIADITGAYVAGIILCSMRDSSYIDEKMEVSSYMIFGPVFFASIGLKTSIDSVDGKILLFSLGFDGKGMQVPHSGLFKNRCRYDDKRRGCTNCCTKRPFSWSFDAGILYFGYLTDYCIQCFDTYYTESVICEG